MKKKILITGGTGFIGYHLAKKCIRLGWEVTSLSKRKPNSIRTLKKVKYLTGDLTKKKDLRVLKKKFDYVVNAAGVVDHSADKNVFKAHYLGCKNLANFFLKKKIKLFLQIGSCVEYGPQKSPQKEDFKSKMTGLKSMYSKGKFAASQYLMKLHKSYKFPVIILRLYLNYGPNQDFNRFLPVIIDGCIRNKKIELKNYRENIKLTNYRKELELKNYQNSDDPKNYKNKSFVLNCFAQDFSFLKQQVKNYGKFITLN